jgi:predicted MPP superfamily phosphohydrolase
LPDISRRDVLKGSLAVAAGIAAGTVVHGYGWERHALEVARVDLPLRALPAALDGVRVGFLTDLHLSKIVPEADVIAAVDAVNRERPDLVVLGGDYVSFADRMFIDPVADLLGKLTPHHGIFAIVGNHDDERRVPAALRRRGIEVLLDARTRVALRGEALEVAGLRFWTREPSEVAAVVGSAPAPTLLLAHDPRRVEEAAALGVAGMLAGHTHGGQVVLPGVGALAARKFPVASGRLTRGATELYVSRGVGTVVIPVRVNCPPEVTLVTLRRAAA